MRKNKHLLKPEGLAVLFAMAIVFIWSATAIAQEDATHTASKLAVEAGDSKNCEPANVSLPTTKVERSPLIEKLHAARKAGDMKTFRELQSQIVKSSPEGESAGGTVLIPTTTFTGVGDPTVAGPNSGPMITAFGSDIKVRPGNLDTKEWNQSMASDSSGTMYVAWQDDNFATGDYIQIYKSSDGGATWAGYGYVKSNVADLKEPCIAVGEGSNGDTLLLAYIYDDGVNIPIPEVATSPLASFNFVTHSVPIWNFWEGYAKPNICTDSVDFSGWYAYLTCEGIFDAVADNINGCTFRSIDGGATWIDPLVPFGNLDAYPWRDIDNSYGTTLARGFLVTFNDDDDSLYVAASDTYGTTWNTPVLFYTMTEVPPYPVDPEIAAAVGNDNVMVCCTKSYNLNANVGQGYSKDAGQTWTTLYSMGGYTSDHEFSISLTANEGGYDWHLAYTTQWRVFYCGRPQDLSGGWTSPMLVDDLSWVSHDYPKKGIASTWAGNDPCICWPDYRDGYPDYDTYSDHPGNYGLSCDTHQIPEGTGASAHFTLNAGPGYANRQYLLIGGVTGWSPGIPLPGGMATLPINWDVFTSIVVSLLNSAVFQNFTGYLNGSGMASATMNVGPVSGATYLSMYFAFATAYPWDYASNAVEMQIVP